MKPKDHYKIIDDVFSPVGTPEDPWLSDGPRGGRTDTQDIRRGGNAALQMFLDAADAMNDWELRDALIVLLNNRMSGADMEAFANEIGRMGHMKARHPEMPNEADDLPFIRRRRAK